MAEQNLYTRRFFSQFQNGNNFEIFQGSGFLKQFSVICNAEYLAIPIDFSENSVIHPQQVWI